MNANDTITDLARLLQLFFCQRLIVQQGVSHQTVLSYRDTFRLLLAFAKQQTGKQISQIILADLDADLVLAFLDYLELQRQNCIRSRNARLAAIRAFLQYAALQEPASLPSIQRMLSIPMKRFDRPMVGYLSPEEMTAVINAPDASTWSGQRDRVLLTMLYNTGARVSEIIAVTRRDIEIERGKAVHLHGKGRKERAVPLWKRTTTLLRVWMVSLPSEPETPLFPNRFHERMSRSGVEKRLELAVESAGKDCPSLQNKTVSPHVIRHTTAMHLLQSGVDLAVIALWLGHESITTTHQYLEADLTLKERALSSLQAPKTKSGRYKPPANILSFLDTL